MNNQIILSDEQSHFVDLALGGQNILVDACIGSGKTTAIQQLCSLYPENKRILYLTYNRLLKLDAKSKILSRNTTVSNYHGFASMLLYRNKIHGVGVQDFIKTALQPSIAIPNYDVLIIDEYQDIDLELSLLLEKIKAFNPGIQIVAVGDMCQKIYDRTTLNVETFITSFIENKTNLEFTKCFRLSEDLATNLGDTWGKTINGVNPDCEVCYWSYRDVIKYLGELDPGDVLCLGSKAGKMATALNLLEERYPEKYNKNTTYASIRENKGNPPEPNGSNAIFTTFDGSKGLERKVCVVFDYTEGFWDARIHCPGQKADILRNIFCVAASRGKNKVIFVTEEDEDVLKWDTMKYAVSYNVDVSGANIDTMFDFKYEEQKDLCYSFLSVKKIQEEEKELDVRTTDGLIDLSPCIDVYQKALFFNNYNIEIDLAAARKTHDDMILPIRPNPTLEDKILIETAMMTSQKRYYTQVKPPIINAKEKDLIRERLCTVFRPEERVQNQCVIRFQYVDKSLDFEALGFADVIRDNVLYQLTFCAEPSHEQFMSCACKMLALRCVKSILWNVRTNAKYEISVADPANYIRAVASTVTKNAYRFVPKPRPLDPSVFDGERFDDEYAAPVQTNFGTLFNTNPCIAVIETETNWNNEAMTIGVIIADAVTFAPVKETYYVIRNALAVGGMYKHRVWSEPNIKAQSGERAEIIRDMCDVFEKYNVSKMFSFSHQSIVDIEDLVLAIPGSSLMFVGDFAVYKDNNRFIDNSVACYKNGRIKHGSGKEAIMRMMSGNYSYSNPRHSLLNARDDLKMIRMLDRPVEDWEEFTKNHKERK